MRLEADAPVRGHRGLEVKRPRIGGVTGPDKGLGPSPEGESI